MSLKINIDSYKKNNNERGVALLLVVFVISITTLLVFDLSKEAFYDQSAARSFSESIQSDFALKSAVNFGRGVLETPKLDFGNVDWLGEPWALSSQLQTFPFEGLPADIKLDIVDEEGKIDLNSITTVRVNANRNGENDQSSEFWLRVLERLFLNLGFVREQHEEEDFVTPGNVSYEAQNQVAVIHDWTDFDSNALRAATFSGQGIESPGLLGLFYNRKLTSISELPLIPGMSAKRSLLASNFVKASPRVNSNFKINVNTAPYQVLVALGFPEVIAEGIVDQRTSEPITSAILNEFVSSDATLQAHTKIRSNEFAIYAMIEMPNITKWVKALVQTSGGGEAGRNTRVISYEVY